MATTKSMSLTTSNSPLRLIVTGGLITFLLHLVIQLWFVYSVLEKSPFISVLQYVASGVMGNAAFMGGFATALLGLVLEFLMILIIAAIFILSAARIPLLRRYAIPGGLLYGFGVFVVMSFVVLPLSAAPPLPAPSLPLFIEIVMDHLLIVGLPLGILVQRNASGQK